MSRQGVQTASASRSILWARHRGGDVSLRGGNWRRKRTPAAIHDAFALLWVAHQPEVFRARFGLGFTALRRLSPSCAEVRGAKSSCLNSATDIPRPFRALAFEGLFCIEGSLTPKRSVAIRFRLHYILGQACARGTMGWAILISEFESSSSPGSLRETRLVSGSASEMNGS